MHRGSHHCAHTDDDLLVGSQYRRKHRERRIEEEVKIVWRKFTTKSYFKARAQGALARQVEYTKEEHLALYKHLRDAYDNDPRCKLCGVTLTADRDKFMIQRGVYKRRRLVRPASASPDRIVPGSQGESYAHDNVQLLCTGCNLCRGEKTMEAARVDLANLLAGERQFDEGGLFVWRVSEPAFALDQDGEAQLDAWAKARLQSVQRTCAASHASIFRKTKSCSLTVQNLQDLARPYMVSNTQYLDPSGPVFDLQDAQIDRLDPMGDYHADNVRMLHGGLNSIRSDWDTDEAPRKYIDGAEAAPAPDLQSVAEAQNAAKSATQSESMIHMIPCKEVVQCLIQARDDVVRELLRKCGLVGGA